MRTEYYTDIKLYNENIRRKNTKDFVKSNSTKNIFYIKYKNVTYPKREQQIRK